MNCPARWKLKCVVCPYVKEGLCDYPFIFNVSVPITTGEDSKTLPNDISKCFEIQKV